MLPPGERIYRLRAPWVTDAWGNGGHYDWSDPVRAPIDRVSVAPRFSDDGSSRWTATIVGITIYCPPGIELLDTDKLEVRGVIYEIEGDAAAWVNPYTQTEVGVQAALRRVDG